MNDVELIVFFENSTREILAEMKKLEYDNWFREWVMVVAVHGSTSQAEMIELKYNNRFRDWAMNYPRILTSMSDAEWKRLVRWKLSFSKFLRGRHE